MFGKTPAVLRTETQGEWTRVLCQRVRSSNIYAVHGHSQTNVES